MGRPHRPQQHLTRDPGIDTGQMKRGNETEMKALSTEALRSRLMSLLSSGVAVSSEEFQQTLGLVKKQEEEAEKEELKKKEELKQKEELKKKEDEERAKRAEAESELNTADDAQQETIRVQGNDAHEPPREETSLDERRARADAKRAEQQAKRAAKNSATPQMLLGHQSGDDVKQINWLEMEYDPKGTGQNEPQVAEDVRIEVTKVVRLPDQGIKYADGTFMHCTFGCGRPCFQVCDTCNTPTCDEHAEQCACNPNARLHPPVAVTYQCRDDTKSNEHYGAGGTGRNELQQKHQQSSRVDRELDVLPLEAFAEMPSEESHAKASRSDSHSSDDKKNKKKKKKKKKKKRKKKKKKKKLEKEKLEKEKEKSDGELLYFNKKFLKALEKKGFDLTCSDEYSRRWEGTGKVKAGDDIVRELLIEVNYGDDLVWKRILAGAKYGTSVILRFGKHKFTNPADWPTFTKVQFEMVGLDMIEHDDGRIEHTKKWKEVLEVVNTKMPLAWGPPEKTFGLKITQDAVSEACWIDFFKKEKDRERRKNSQLLELKLRSLVSKDDVSSWLHQEVTPIVTPIVTSGSRMNKKKNNKAQLKREQKERKALRKAQVEASKKAKKASRRKVQEDEKTQTPEVPMDRYEQFVCRMIDFARTAGNSELAAEDPLESETNPNWEEVWLGRLKKQAEADHGPHDPRVIIFHVWGNRYHKWTKVPARTLQGKKLPGAQENYSAMCLTGRGSGVSLKTTNGTNPRIQKTISRCNAWKDWSSGVIDSITKNGYNCISINCSAGKHRSVGAAVLLKELKYPNAELHWVERETGKNQSWGKDEYKRKS